MHKKMIKRDWKREVNNYNRKLLPQVAADAISQEVCRNRDAIYIGGFVISWDFQL